MRVLTFLHSFEVGGVERDALRLNAELARRGVDVHIALGRTDGQLAAEAPDLTYHVLQGPGHSSTARYETLFMIARLPGLVRNLRPDILHCPGNTYTVVAFFLRLILGRRCPPIVLKVSNDLRRGDLSRPLRVLYHIWLRLQAPVFAAVVGMVEPVREEIARYMAKPNGRIVIIDNGCFRERDMERLAAIRDATVGDRTSHRRAGRHYLAVGRLAPQKNFVLLVEAFAGIARPDDRLTIVGEGDERTRLDAEIARLGIGDRVALPGHVHPLDSYYADADAFVLSSDYEGLGVVVLEAMAAGVPVVATDCCVAMKSLVSGVGALVAPRDPAALADAMETVLTRPPLTTAMRSRAAGFTVESAASAWLTLFGHCLADRAQRAGSLGLLSPTR